MQHLYQREIKSACDSQAVEGAPATGWLPKGDCARLGLNYEIFYRFKFVVRDRVWGPTQEHLQQRRGQKSGDHDHQGGGAKESRIEHMRGEPGLSEY